MTAAARTKRSELISDRLAIVRDRGLLDLIEALEEGLNVLSLLDDVVVDVTAPLERAIAYLVELRDRNGGSAP